MRKQKKIVNKQVIELTIQYKCYIRSTSVFFFITLTGRVLKKRLTNGLKKKKIDDFFL